jgi:hypothetical protein
MKVHLSMWQRLGVVASVLWMLGGGLWMRSRYADMSLVHYGMTRDACAGSEGECLQAANDAADQVLKSSWPEVVSFALAPIILGWVLAYAIVWTARWILAGRHPRT